MIELDASNISEGQDKVQELNKQGKGKIYNQDCSKNFLNFVVNRKCERY